MERTRAAGDAPGSHDHVIVGAGSAGCVLAARLTEDPDVSVLLIEAGPVGDDPLIHAPVGFGALLKSRFDWDDASEPEPHLNGRRIPLSRGRVLGGSSTINAMIYLRGNPVDFDGWAALGLDGWGWDDVLPYFRRSEDNERWENAYHARGGPLGVSESRAMTPHVDAMIDAAVQTGVPRNEDPNGERQDGVGRWQSTTRGGVRCSAATAFLHPALERPNLEVVTRAEVQRIVLDGRRATGVVYERHGETVEVRARREVLVAAGAYGSPGLLMLSGLGPADDLTALGIPVVEDLPVGENLQDHCMVPVSAYARGGTLEMAASPENADLYARELRGPMASNVGEGGMFTRSRSGLPAPDLQFAMVPVMVHEDLLGAATASAISVIPTVVAPVSRGRVALRAPFPGSRLRILHNYLEAPEDRDALVAGVQLALEVLQQDALREVTTGIHKAPASSSVADVTAYVRAATHTIYHPVGTCAMGAVVDEECRVLGVEGLRVVDASVMPRIPRANTNAATIMIGEKVADLVRGHRRAPEARMPGESG